MNRFFFTFILAIFVILPLSAQNANRSGFFLEAGVGGAIGNTPRVSISASDNNLSFKCASGVSVDFGLGYRLRTSAHWAYEFKAEAQSCVSSLESAFVARALIAGFRYTSVELWRNFSLYGHFNAGGAMASQNGLVENDFYHDFYGTTLSTSTFYPDMRDCEIRGFVDSYSGGVAYSLGIGINVTTHFYAEAFWDAQVMFGCYGKNGKGTLHWGMSGIAMGYRF